MNSVLKLTILLTVLITAGCATKYQTVTFEKKRTPLNPIAHKGVVNYNPKVTLMYAEAPLLAKKEYDTEVARRKQQYNEALLKYNNASIQERILQGLTKPQLILPQEPEVPFIYNEADIENRIKIEGMDRGTNSALEINLFYEGYEVNDVKVVQSTKKRKKDDVEYIDTLYTGQAKVKHEIRLFAQSPLGAEYNEYVPETKSYKTLKTQNFDDSLTAHKNILVKVKEEEEQIGISNIQYVNKLLNSQFGTQDVQYSVKVFTFESNNKNDYSDLQEASLSAQMGFKVLNTDPNNAYEKLNKAYSIWTDALNEFSPNKKARINEKVKKGILLNLISVSVFTENWDGAIRYITELENMKTKGTETAELNRLKQIRQDLKSRYDALAE